MIHKSLLKIFSFLSVTSILGNPLSAIAGSCPDPQSERIDFRRLTPEKRFFEASDGKKYKCWWDQKAKPLIFRESTYRVVTRCSKDLALYTHFDSGSDAVIKRTGIQELYEEKFLGDRFECDVNGEKMIKPFEFRKGTEVVKLTIYSYSYYKK
jgi:hypothetical protein